MQNFNIIRYTIDHVLVQSFTNIPIFVLERHLAYMLSKNGIQKWTFQSKKSKLWAIFSVENKIRKNVHWQIWAITKCNAPDVPRVLSAGGGWFRVQSRNSKGTLMFFCHFSTYFRQPFEIRPIDLKSSYPSFISFGCTTPTVDEFNWSWKKICLPKMLHNKQEKYIWL